MMNLNVKTDYASKIEKQLKTSLNKENPTPLDTELIGSRASLPFCLPGSILSS